MAVEPRPSSPFLPLAAHLAGLGSKPNDEQDAWRATWSGAFSHRIGHVIRTADALLLAYEAETRALRSLRKAFQTALIHDRGASTKCVI